MIVGIVGNEAAKFTQRTENLARVYIRWILKQPGVTGLTSGACHLGGVDIYAEEEARIMNKDLFIFPPKTYNWSNGYKPRNILIARKCDALFNIVVAEYPQEYTGMRFSACYHCGMATDHVKSGGCWTRNFAAKLGKPTQQIIVR